MCIEQKATPVHADAAAGLELTCILSLLSLFFPLLPFPVFFFFLFFFLLFFKAGPGLPAIVDVIKNRVTPVPPRSGGSEERETEGRREGECQQANLKSEPGERLCV